MKKAFLASLFVLLPMSVSAQIENHPARNAGICYAALSLRSPPPPAELEKRSEFKKYQALWEKAMTVCHKSGAPASYFESNAYKTCMMSNKMTENSWEYFLGYAQASGIAKANKFTNMQLELNAVKYCTF
jgi:hypothetical protein